jgi:hypothetical protein
MTKGIYDLRYTIYERQDLQRTSISGYFISFRAGARLFLLDFVEGQT